jgi:hypothetical protein
MSEDNDIYFYEDLPPFDVVVEPGVRVGLNGTERIIGVMANSDKGVDFLTAYLDGDPDTEAIGSASLYPEELASLKKQANLAGVALWIARRLEEEKAKREGIRHDA